jgi:transposase-like protein
LLASSLRDGDAEAAQTDDVVELSWTSRGLGGVQLVISDAHTGLKAAIEAVLIGSAWQRSSADISTRRDVPVGHLRRRERTLAA